MKNSLVLGRVVVASWLWLGVLASCENEAILSGSLSAESPGPEPPGAADFRLPAGETQVVGEAMIIEATGVVDIDGALIVENHNGQSITLKAGGDVRISGSIRAGNGGAGGDGGDITIISEGGDIVLAEAARLAAGDGGDGETTIAEVPTGEADGDRAAQGSGSQFLITGGAGGHGGTVTLRAPNGQVVLPYVEGIVHIGNGGDGQTIEVQSHDLLILVTPEILKNAGGDSGLLVVEAASFNGAATPADGPIDIESDLFFTGGQGGAAGDFIYGLDAEGNSTWPSDDGAPAMAAKAGTTAKGAATVSQKIYKDLRRSGAKGGDGYLKPGAGGSVRIRGRNGAAPGTDGQIVRASGGWGGHCKSPLCLEGGNGGSADAMGGNGARGKNPNGTGGDGGKTDANGGLGGVGLVNNGRHGDAFAFGGYGGKGGGTCIKNVTTTGGRGGMGGYAWAYAGKSKAIASGGKGGDGGDGRKYGGPVGSGGLATASNGTGSKRIDGKKGDPGATCPPVAAVQIRAGSSTFFGAGTKMALSCIEGGEVSPPDESCDCRHLHGEITLKPFGVKYPDPDPDGCGHGCIVEADAKDVDYACD